MFISQLDFKSSLSSKAKIITDELQKVCDNLNDVPQPLYSAIKYTLAAGGKRLRAAIVLWCNEVFLNIYNQNALAAGCAVEMVHTYSLIHDDLPAMDDDDIRRGQPSCHKAFDEATAILTGDALLTYAFEYLAEKIDNPSVAVRLIHTLSKAAGPAGMIAGQIADLQAENAEPDEKKLSYIHLCKTARMFEAAAAMGAITADARPDYIEALKQYGLYLGLAFQVMDDILDVSSSTERLGKTAGKDAGQGKMTYPYVYGVEESRRFAEKFSQQAVCALKPFGRDAQTLRTLVETLYERTK